MRGYLYFLTEDQLPLQMEAQKDLVGVLYSSRRKILSRHFELGTRPVLLLMKMLDCMHSLLNKKNQIIFKKKDREIFD